MSQNSPSPYTRCDESLMRSWISPPSYCHTKRRSHGIASRLAESINIFTRFLLNGSVNHFPIVLIEERFVVNGNMVTRLSHDKLVILKPPVVKLILRELISFLDHSLDISVRSTHESGREEDDLETFIIQLVDNRTRFLKGFCTMILTRRLRTNCAVDIETEDLQLYISLRIFQDEYRHSCVPQFHFWSVSCLACSSHPIFSATSPTFPRISMF